MELAELLVTAHTAEHGTKTLSWDWQGEGPILITAELLQCLPSRDYPMNRSPSVGDEVLLGPFVCRVTDWDAEQRLYRFERISG